MKGPVVGIVVVLALLATGAIFYVENAFTSAPEVFLEQTYGNDLLGISFTYPVGYILAENEVGVPERAHHLVTIVTETDAVPRVNSEGPTAITLDFYQNGSDAVSIEQWLKTEESNFQLGDGKSEITTLHGADAIRYRWSGLYEGETVVFLHNERIVAISVTYQSTADPIYIDYQTLLSSLRLR